MCIVCVLLSDQYSLPNIVRVVKSRRMRWAGHVARMGQGRGVYRVLVGKPEVKRPLGRPRRRWDDYIKMDLQEVGGGCEDWMELAQDRDRWRALVSTVMNFRVPKMRGISWLAAYPVTFSIRTLLHGVSRQVSKYLQNKTESIRRRRVLVFMLLCTWLGYVLKGYAECAQAHHNVSKCGIFFTSVVNSCLSTKFSFQIKKYYFSFTCLTELKPIMNEHSINIRL